MPPCSKQELLDSGVTDIQLTGDLGKWTPLDRPQKERTPLADAQFPENRRHESALDHRRLGIGVTTGIGNGIRSGLIHLRVAAQHLEAMILRGCQQPRARMSRRRPSPEGFDGLKKHFLGRIGSILGLAQQEVADEVNG
jgi:hypothetical protein